MAMKIFEVSFTRCCPCFLELLKEALYESDRKKDTSALMYQYVSSRYEGGFVTETYVCSATILFSCFSHLLQIFCFDFIYCNHYQKRTYFTVLYKENNLCAVRKCYAYYRKSVQRLLYNFPCFYYPR